MFESTEFGSVRVVEKDGGEPWFVANEVAEVLGYCDPKQAIRAHCKHPKLLKGVESTLLTSSPRGINLIPQGDVYRLIARSKLPAAERFQDWVCDVAKALGYVNQAKAVRMHCKKVNNFAVAQKGLPDFIKKNPSPPNLIPRGDDEQTIITNDSLTTSRNPNVSAVSEPGLYSLIHLPCPGILPHLRICMRGMSGFFYDNDSHFK